LPPQLRTQSTSVLRVRKLPLTPPSPTLATIEAALDGDAAAAALAAALGPDFVPAPTAVALPPALVAALSARLASCGRASASRTPPPPLAHTGALHLNATLLWEAGGAPSTPCLCVEVKPKSGWPHEKDFSPATRFRLLQEHAAALNDATAAGSSSPTMTLGYAAAAKSAAKAAGAPGYCPGDLFSGAPPRVASSLAACAAGGRLHVFVDGRPVRDAQAALASATWAGGAGGVLAALTAVLTRAAPAALASLAAAQAPPPACPSSAAAAAALDAAVAAVEGGEGVPEHVLTALRAHLSAAAARDASVLVALAPENEKRADPAAALCPQRSLCAGGTLPADPAGLHPPLRFRLALVDVGGKALGKVRVHAAADAALREVVVGRKELKK